MRILMRAGQTIVFLILAGLAGGAWVFADSGHGATGDEIANSLRRQIGYCWEGAGDLPPAHRIDVLLRFSLDRDGGIAGAINILSPEAGNGLEAPTSRPAVQKAVAAVTKCAPYNLPKEHYDIWDDVEVTIGPVSMSLVS
jgi:hypothetical protein